MAENEHHQPPPPSSPPPSRPTTITLPPRSFPESFFSPGPMTLLSTFFSDSDDCTSFSQLLAGALSPPNKPQNPPPLPFTIPSPNFLDSPGHGGLFSPQGTFGMTHQQALAQVTSLASSFFHAQDDNARQEFVMAKKESEELCNSDKRAGSAAPAASVISVDKPVDDGYNWRKYGQKQVKGSEFPRSYYKCTHPSCIVKKKVERSFDGQVTEIIYKGQHNHGPPQNGKRVAKDIAGNSNNQKNFGLGSQFQSGNCNRLKDGITSSEHVSGTSDSEDVGNSETCGDENGDGPDPKRRKTEEGLTEAVSSHRTVTEPRIIVQTNSEVDLLDDGYKWRKYGQKVVKGNSYPRSYYKCTTQGCNVRKHVERAAADPRAVITTYEGKHNHDVPAARTSSHNTASGNASSQWKSHGVENNATINNRNNQQPISRLRLKEEQIT